ncbi:MAG: alpha/beta hydrolase, partial [Pseudomonadota bacterium]
MSKESLHPELRDTIAKLPTLPFHIKPLIPLTRQLYNLASKSKLDDGIDVRVVKHGELEMRVFKPRTGGSNAGVVWCYGGGHLAGKTEHVNRIANRIIAETGATVFAPKYRLAPKNPYPADLDDCFRCWEHVCRNANTYGVSQDRLAIGGHSAGGGLAAALALRIHDSGG